jgi:hypothetical protein
MRTFILTSLSDNDEDWHDVATKTCAISTQLGSPIFILTFTMNLYWYEHQAIKRDSGTFADSEVIVSLFKTRLSTCMQFLQSHNSLGEILEFVWRIEYQQRDFPHTQLLFWTDCDTQDHRGSRLSEKCSKFNHISSSAW